MDPVEARQPVVRENTPTGPPVDAVGPPPAPAGSAVVPAAGTTTTATSVGATRTMVSPGGYRAVQFVWLIAGVLDIILALDFVFRAASAADTGFYHYVYALGSRLARPFNGIFNAKAAFGQSQLRWADVVGIVVFSLAGWIVVKVIRIVTTPKTTVTPV
ncbi:MAG: hypothetical protein M3R48_05515 [Candidatus Dormibacteraeota bacterium]|nr:hypothetical protein [Candidatus Dormibacteraeota bacterium]